MPTLSSSKAIFGKILFWIGPVAQNCESNWKSIVDFWVEWKEFRQIEPGVTTLHLTCMYVRYFCIYSVSRRFQTRQGKPCKIFICCVILRYQTGSLGILHHTGLRLFSGQSNLNQLLIFLLSNRSLTSGTCGSQVGGRFCLHVLFVWWVHVMPFLGSSFHNKQHSSNNQIYVLVK